MIIAFCFDFSPNLNRIIFFLSAASNSWTHHYRNQTNKWSINLQNFNSSSFIVEIRNEKEKKIINMKNNFCLKECFLWLKKFLKEENIIPCICLVSFYLLPFG